MLAGPGTGKTRLLTYRIAGLIRRELAYPAEIMAITFTRKASTEIRERVERLLGQDVADLTISTIDALAYAILYAESGNKPIKVADERESAKLIAQAIEQVGLDKRVWTVRRLVSDISRSKDRGLDHVDLLIRGHGYDNVLYAFAALALNQENRVALTALVENYPAITPSVTQRLRREHGTISFDLLAQSLADSEVTSGDVDYIMDLIGLCCEDLPQRAPGSPVAFLDYALERSGYGKWLESNSDKLARAQALRQRAAGFSDVASFVHAIETAPNSHLLTIGKVFEAYQKLLTQAGQIDFNDLPVRAMAVLRRDASIAEFHRARARFILVDEFQDTSRSQYALIRALTGLEHNVTVVGSPAQAVYARRGADPEYLFDAFRRDFPDLQEIILQEHYRCNGTVLAAASSVINGKYPDARNLVPRKSLGDPVQIGRFDTEIEMAEFVARQIRQWHAAQPGRKWNDCVVLYRTNNQSDAIQAAFTAAQVPYSLPQGQIAMLERPEVKHLLAYASLAIDPSDGLALTEIVNVPPRQIGAASLQKIKAGHDLLNIDLLGAAMGMDLRAKTLEGILDLIDVVSNDLPGKALALSPVEFIDYVLDRTGYHDWILSEIDYYKRWANVKWLRQRASEHDSVADFVRAMKAMESQELETPRGVALNTIHGVKGLEFPVVFMIGLEEGKLPHRQALKLHSDPDEERRLCYVGMTRAKECLYLLGSRTERVNGHYERVSPSRYLADIPTSVSARC